MNKLLPISESSNGYTVQDGCWNCKYIFSETDPIVFYCKLGTTYDEKGFVVQMRVFQVHPCGKCLKWERNSEHK